MSSRRAQRGAVGALVIAIMVIVMLGLVATYVLSRIVTSSDEGTTASQRLARAAEALDAYAANAARLPCPADPTLDTGTEVPTAAGAATCTFPMGTLPWRTIGLKREDAYDTWGRKISYRVYTGTNGSLTQPGGVSMVYCDTIEPAPGGPTAGAGGTGGLCNQGASETARNTTPAQFLQNKGLDLNDHGTAHNSTIAYVLVSHGPTGLGGYTVSGAMLDLPAGDERNNTRATGPFTIKAFSDVDTAATSGVHFDDLLAYRTVSDLVRRTNLAARDWPEVAGPPPTATAAYGVSFTAAAVATAAGVGGVTAGSGVGTGNLSFTGANVSGRDSGSAASEVSYGEGSGFGGIGVSGGGDARIQSSANEFLRIEFAEAFSKFAITLNDLGYFAPGDGGFYVELVEFRFYLSNVQVGSPLYGISCDYDGRLASFSMDVGAEFNRVDVVPVPAFNFFGDPGITSFYVSEIKACPASDPTCRADLDDPANSANTRCS